ncbi:RagB/SusD family nutrient uptake outer membrane protein [Catalinimonas niigatensis]|uniref:RagB/SusD family nutrient uptake outer membrane protein n=1 Tax=Catalinimonas niigatensis TaxID=1397264 RepID=UPI0026651702|nr:RagB/SusD family nutrient uptake outer membrane protein [Catalinimonas niigatensis]WPP49544.1 RagB/SusD family nutrient uptake outer membrane protein [Catalinimonas niigatensis]
MMNAVIKYRFLLAIAGLSTVLLACDDYLEENPDNRVELNTLEKAAQLLTNAYSPAGYNFVEWMGDQVVFTRGTQKRPNQLRTYQWEETLADPNDQDTPEYYWNGTYQAIAHANEVLAVVDQLPGDEALRRAVKGEALLTRAYGHFMLVNMFAKHYDEATASRDLGVPYVTTPETEFLKEYSRNTVAEVYDLVEEDLLQGLELVNDSYYANSGKYHFTRTAALALASRFYLFKRDYNECIRYSSELLGSNPTNYVKDIPALLQERINTEDYISLYTSPDDPSNILLLRQETIFYRNVGFFPDNNLYNGLFNSNPFRATDLRSDPAYVRGEDGIIATRFENLFQRTSLTSDVGFPYTIFLGFRGEEVLLNRAEAYVYLNRLDEAIADLQTLSDKRYDSQVTVDLETIRNYIRSGNPQNDVLIYIIELERPKEFIHEGLRWFDIKRFDLPVEHTLADGSVITLEAEDNRKALQIPEAAQEIGNLEPNPR